MRGYFDEEEDEPLRPKRDTELTLGFGTLLSIFFGLVLLCGLCFGLGYEVGRGNRITGVTLPAGEPAKPSSLAKPSAVPQTQQSQPQDQQSNSETENVTVQETPSSAPVRQAAAPQAVNSAPRQTAPATTAAQRPRQNSYGNGSTSLTVQVAAVSNPEDGEALGGALRRHGYAVIVRRESDNLTHVRIGPFATREDASHWRQKLLNDGYNAVIQ